MLLSAFLAVAVLPACRGGTGAAPDPQHPSNRSTDSADADSRLVRIDIDAAGNHYLIDTATETCLWVVATANKPGAIRVSCRLLRDNVEEARPHIAWVEELPEPAADPRGRSVASRRPRDRSFDTQRIAESIRRIGESEFEIDRDFLDYVLQNPARRGRGARIVPSIKDGAANGFKLYAIRPGSIYAALGLKNGDTVHAVNGHSLASPDKALEVYIAVREADEVRIELTRRGAAETLLWRIVP